MLKWFFARQIAQYEKQYNYSMDYVKGILNVGVGPLLKFRGLFGLAQYHEDIPAEAWYTAKIVAAMAEDCGPCVQIVVDMASKAKVDKAQIRAVVTGDIKLMSANVLLAYRFTKATLAHAPESDELRDEILSRWGDKAIVSLAFGIAGARLFPTIKYVMGYGKTCTKVKIPGESETFKPILDSMAV